MIVTKNVCFQYAGASEMLFPDIELPDGEHLLILGDSGIGKTTLLHLIAGLLSPKSGIIEINGANIHQLSNSKLDYFRGSYIGIVYQRHYLFQSITIKESLQLIQNLVPKNESGLNIDELLTDLGIHHLRNKKPKHLSQGEQQRAAIAMALVNNPEFILADEPTSSLDDTSCSKVIALLKQTAQKTSASLLIITHDQRLKNEFENTLHL